MRHKEIDFPQKDKKLLQIIFAAFILSCMLIGFLSFRYYLQLQDTIHAENQGYMQEISHQIGNNVDKIVATKYSVLNTMKLVLNDLNINSYEQLRQIDQEHKRLWQYKKMLLIDENGLAHDHTGTAVTLRSDSCLQDVIVRKEPSLSSSQMIDGVESILFSIPLSDITISGTKMAALAISYNLDTFDQILDITAFEGKGYAHIIRKDGTVVIRSSSPNALEMGYNILNSLAEDAVISKDSMAKIKTDIANGIHGQVEFTIGNHHEYMTYTPLDVQNWSLLTFVPVEVVNARSSLLLNITLLLCSMITILFTLLLGVLMFTFFRHKRKLEQLAYVDPITEGNTIERFYESAQKLLDMPGKPTYALVYTNIEKFKVLNEQFGRLACDQVLRGIEKGISKDLYSNECIGRLFADNFCILVTYTGEDVLCARFQQWHENAAAYLEAKGAIWLPLIMEFGVYIIENDTLPFPQLIDRAKLSLNDSVRELHGKMRYAIYDERMRHLLLREKNLEDQMEAGLRNHEFSVYLQPKYCTKTEKIGGAEALVRWQNKTEGIIMPDEFIPLFEKNGFVLQVDFYVFETVCQTLRRWLDAGITPLKISVNCSRLHLKNIDFLNQYRAIADRYQVPPALLEIELTESTVFEDVVHLSDIIRSIHAAGFGCSMDDFGSGYSSLNLIQDIPVDTLKLDKVFFRSTRDITRSESVVGSILNMSKALNMVTVAEGVEEQSQVDMLKRLECDYIQGFFFAKPMPISQFEQLTFGKQIPAAESKQEEVSS